MGIRRWRWGVKKPEIANLLQHAIHKAYCSALRCGYRPQRRQRVAMSRIHPRKSSPFIWIRTGLATPFDSSSVNDPWSLFLVFLTH
jgi:hypothetical protein